MSGEMGFLLAIPVMVLAVPVAIAGTAAVAVARVGAAAGRAAIAYEQQRRRDREEIRQSGIREEIGEYRSQVKKMMTEQKIKNQNLSLSFERMLLENRNNFLKKVALMEEDVEGFERETRNAAREMLMKMDEQQTNLQKAYQNVIADELSSIQRESQEQFEEMMQTIQSYEKDSVERKQRLQHAAHQYLEEAKDLVKALELQFDGKKYCSRELLIHQSDIHSLQAQYDAGHYEGCLIAANELLSRVKQDILTADEKHQEFENWQKMACMLIEENKTWMETQKTFTQEMYDAMQEQAKEQESELGLSESDIGIDLSGFWGVTEQGTSVFDEMYQKLVQLKQMVDTQTCEMTTKELKEICTQMTGTWRTEISKKNRDAFMEWNHALQREKLGNDIIDRMEDMGYEYKNFAYIRTKKNDEMIRTEDEDIGAELCMTFVDGYGDEVLVRLGSQSGAQGKNTAVLQITDMAEEMDEEIDKSSTRREMEDVIHEIVEGNEYQGRAEGGCVKGTERKVVVNEKNRRMKHLVDGE